MNLSTEAKHRLYEIVLNAVETSLEGDSSREFVLSILNSEPDGGMFSRMLYGERKTLLQTETDRHVRDLINEVLKEIFDKDFKARLRATLLANSIQEDVMFAGKAAVSEFIGRVKAPIQGDMIKIRLFNSSDEEDED